MNILENYWTGVLQRLQAEVDVFNQLIEHQGEKGTQNELALARIIERLIPSRYGVGSGLIIDSLGNYSTQTDIIIFERADEPALMAQTGQVLFPIENVRACIEVKTSASSDEIADAGGKFESIRNLESRLNSDRRPIYGFLGYNAKTSPVALAKNFARLSDTHRPDIACVLKSALIAGRADALDPGSSDSLVLAGVTQLHRISDGRRSPGVFEQAPDDWEELKTVINGLLYPLVPIPKGPTLVVEPSRALLLFCDALIRGLLRSEGRNDSTFSYYIPNIAREMTEVLISGNDGNFSEEG